MEAGGGWGRARPLPRHFLPGCGRRSRSSAFALAVVASVSSPPSSDPRPGGSRLLRGYTASFLPRSLFSRPPPLLLLFLAAAQDRRPGYELRGSSQVRRPGRASVGPRRHGGSGRWAAGGLGLAGARATAQARLRPRGLPGGGGPSAALVGPVPELGGGAGRGWADPEPPRSRRRAQCTVLQPLPSRGTWCQFPALPSSQVTSYSFVLQL